MLLISSYRLGLASDNQFAMSVARTQEACDHGAAYFHDDTFELEDQVCCDTAS